MKVQAITDINEMIKLLPEDDREFIAEEMDAYIASLGRVLLTLHYEYMKTTAKHHNLEVQEN